MTREEQLIEAALSDKADKQIAFELGISINTVRSYWQRVYAKYGVQTRTGLVLEALRRGYRLPGVEK